MKSSKLLILGMFIISLGAAELAMAATPTFTGDVEADFTGPGILIIPDAEFDVGLPGNAPGGTVSGWNIKDLRLTYDSGSDTLYVGINAFGIAGDADGDGNPGSTSTWLADNGGEDLADFNDSECFAVFFDLDQDGNYDVIAGVSGSVDISGASINEFDGSPSSPQEAFGTVIGGSAISVYASPSSGDPDVEFTITNFSSLPDQTPVENLLGGFKVQAYMGSQADNGIGEDAVTYEQSPSTIVDIISSAITDGTVDLTVTEYNDGDVPLTDVEVVVNDGSTDIAVLNAGNVTSGDGGVAGTLEAGETWTWSYTTITALEDIAIGAGKTFTATGSGTDPADIVVTYPADPNEQATVTVVPLPCIEVTKVVNCEKSKEGDEVIYTICIKNCGPTMVYPTLIYDDQLGDLLPDFEDGCFDGSRDPLYLETGEECCLDFPFVMPAGPDPFVNIVEFEADDEYDQHVVADPCDASVDLVHPELTVTKSCVSPDQVVEPGGIAMFAIQVMNTGDVCLDVTLVDPCDVDFDCGPFTLQPGEMETCQVEIDVPEDTTAIEIWNQVSATWTICNPPSSEEPPCLLNEETVDANAYCRIAGGATRTPGFWKTHYNYTEHILIDMIPDCLGGPCIDLGWIEVCDMNEVCAVFWANKSNNTDGSKRSKLCQARMHASFHALAAIFNNCMPSGGGIPVDPLDIAAILGGDDIGAIKDLASILADYNESGDDVAIIDPWGPPGSATPSECKDVDLSFADCLEGSKPKPGKGPK